MIVEDAESLRGRLMKKEKMIRDVMSIDARQGYQFMSSVKKDFDKEKSVLAVKLSFLYKIIQIFSAPRVPSGLDDLILMATVLQTTIQSQMAKLDELWAANRDAPAAGAGGVDVKAAIQQYIQAKELMKKKTTEFVLKHRSAIIQTRAKAAVDYMKKNGEVNPQDEPAVQTALRNKETEILLDIVYPEVAKKTERLEATVNRLVSWRGRMAAMPPDTWNNPAVVSEKNALFRDFLQAVEEVKNQALEGITGAGIFKAPDAVEMMNALKVNLNEQRIRSGGLIGFIEGLKTADASLPMHEVEGSAAAQGACDKIDELVKSERNVYVDVRKWEPEPGRFFEDMASAVKFPEREA